MPMLNSNSLILKLEILKEMRNVKFVKVFCPYYYFLVRARTWGPFGPLIYFYYFIPLKGRAYGISLPPVETDKLKLSILKFT
jgi:hypothetical protein